MNERYDLADLNKAKMDARGIDEKTRSRTRLFRSRSSSVVGKFKALIDIGKA